MKKAAEAINLSVIRIFAEPLPEKVRSAMLFKAYSAYCEAHIRDASPYHGLMNAANLWGEALKEFNKQFHIEHYLPVEFFRILTAFLLVELEKNPEKRAKATQNLVKIGWDVNGLLKYTKVGVFAHIRQLFNQPIIEV